MIFWGGKTSILQPNLIYFLIQVVKKDGVEQYEICPEENYYPMFFRPWYVKVDPHGVNIYVSDCNRSQMACIITGNVLKKYTYKVEQILHLLR